MTDSLTRTSVTFSSPVWWAKEPWLGALLGRAFSPLSQPLLIMSLPRGGSSWVGSILGNASNAMYLREPVNQSFLASGGTTTVFDVDLDSPPEDYARFTERAFKGIPVFPSGVVQSPKQWSLASRRGKVLVIKEVNPLALPWMLEKYRPRVIYLIRHPAAVASSYWSQGWCNAEEKLSQLSARFMNDPFMPWYETINSASGFWQAHGVFQGAVLRVVDEALSHYKDCRIERYEDICIDPEAKFLELLEFAGLSIDDSIRSRIADSTSGDEQGKSNAYSTRRQSREMTRAWVNKVDEKQLADLRSGYSAFGLPYYNSESDWAI